nr:indole-3-acetic acid-amido synthetase GH3.17-like [Coffea arabica]XP_027092554.1 indole-3-acetic acid-amido synthetase GH3.17-like [Coffea arabica]XP_027092555.1 indole-3-acetic acid-amido synthetase GH3.17-like [Coffea arabica]XP_027092556.1 indole-3-acetic acid-amido synthetase GH3.17-like [Coffea arabica]
MLPTFDPRDTEAGSRILEDITSNAGHIQEQVLEEILTKNASTDYLKGFLNGYSDKELFKNKVPVVDYEDIKIYIDRIALDGEPSQILTNDSITELLISSGTSGGKQKWIPKTAEEGERRAFFFCLLATVQNRYLHGLNDGKALFFVLISPDTHTPGGLVLRTTTASEIKNRKDRYPQVIFCEDTNQSLYSQLLCGLVQRDEIASIGTFFASGLLRIIKFFEEHWQEMSSNIRTGQMSDWITDPKCKRAVSLILSKQIPDLADSIDLVCQEKSWEGIIKKIWPRTKYVQAIITGSMAQYIPALEFYTGRLPIVSPAYVSSEACFGINLKPLCSPYDVSYTLIPNMAYYEFIPIGNHQDPNCTNSKDAHLKDHIVDLANVKIGQHYELLVTTCTGLYRYRMGDVLLVTGFHNITPQFKFVQRRNVVLSIDTDKTTEQDLQNAVTIAMHILEPLGFFLLDYSSYADTSSIPGHYVLFWELQLRSNDDFPVLDQVKMEKCCSLVEQSLDLQYKMLRNQSNTIGPLEVRVVKQGSFNVLMDFYVSQGTSLNQYKTPKNIKSEKAIEILDSRVVGKFYSREVPNQDS